MSEEHRSIGGPSLELGVVVVDNHYVSATWETRFTKGVRSRCRYSKLPKRNADRLFDPMQAGRGVTEEGLAADTTFNESIRIGETCCSSVGGNDTTSNSTLFL